MLKMMSLRNIQLVSTLVLLLITLATSYDCPEDCHCVIIKGSRPHNHAKCTSLNGLVDSKNLPIHSIDLSNAGLTKISNHLEKLRDLTSVDLSNNELSEIGRLGRRVKTLNLSHNKITSGKLTKVPVHIQNLDVSFNEITYLPMEITNLTKLRTIELVGNKINCSCETLDVRNWLQEQHVYTDNHVKCAYPHDVKSKPWLQVKQSEVCAHEKQIREVNEDDNDLMMGDQPVEDEGSLEKEDEELGKDFLPVSEATKPEQNDEHENDDVEGSGDLSVPSMPIRVESLQPTQEPKSDDQTEKEEDESSGSGLGPLIVPHLNFDDDNKNNTEEEAAPSADIFGAGLGIVQFGSDTHSEQPAEVTEEPIVPVKVSVNSESKDSSQETEHVEGSDVNENNSEKASIVVPNEDLEKANSGNSTGTYILFAVILLVVLGLIVYVALKRSKTNSRNRAHDAENPRETELADMDKARLGKPLHKNGHTEHAPLIGDRNKTDLAKPMNGNKRPYDDGQDKNIQQPLLNDAPPANNTSDGPESNNNIEAKPATDQAPIPAVRTTVDNSDHRIIPRYPPPKSPRASKQNNSDDDYLPSSPKSGRYSPVYSPETGKVKIKLTETPKPKTPLLVTRSKSNAGDIITTPVHASNRPSHQETNNNNVQ